MFFNFKNKTVLVTGSNTGNGYAIAKAYSKLKANVIRVDKKFTTKMKSKDIIFDLKDYNQIKNLVISVKKASKRVDILINNAGISLSSSNPYKDFISYHKTLSVNLHSPFSSKMVRYTQSYGRLKLLHAVLILLKGLS